MPCPRQPDHKLNKDRSVIDTYSRVFVEVKNVAAPKINMYSKFLDSIWFSIIYVIECRKQFTIALVLFYCAL